MMDVRLIPPIQKVKLDGLSNASKHLFLNGFRINEQSLSDNGDIFCTICKQFTDNDDTRNLEIGKQQFWACKDCFEVIGDRLNLFTDEQKLSEESYAEFKEFRQKNNIQLDNRKCPSCNEIVFYPVDRTYGCFCLNPNCDDGDFCYYFNRCGNHIANGAYGETWGDKQSGEPSDVSLCKGCWDACKCKISDKGKITKRDENCFRHKIKSTDKTSTKESKA